MKHTTTAAVITAGVLLVGGLGGCSSSGGGGGESPSPQQTVEATPNGVEDLTAKQIMDKAKTAATSASSVTIKANVSQEGQELTIDLTLTKDGAQGTFGTANVGSLQVVSTPGVVYVKGDDSFNESFGGEAGAKLLAGKWLSIPSDDPQASSFSGFANIDALTSSLLEVDSDTFTKEGAKEVGGVACVGIKSDDGTFWVATVGEPFPMEVTPPEEQTGSLTFSGWNAPVTITPPPAEEVVDMSQLGAATSSPSPTESATATP